jgi:hypothetical protein
MAYSAIKTMEEMLNRYDVSYRRVAFVVPVAGARFGDAVRADLEFTMTEVPFHRSETFTREAIIYPALRDVWRPYRDALTLLSGEPLDYDDNLRGELDYMVCRRSPRGPLVPDRPVLLVGEAKREDSTRGWNQALGGMIAARMIDPTPGRVFYGLVTTGSVWRFGKLDGPTFTEDPRPFGLDDLDRLAGALHFAFAACRDQLLAAAAGP